MSSSHNRDIAKTSKKKKKRVHTRNIERKHYGNGDSIYFFVNAAVAVEWKYKQRKCQHLAYICDFSSSKLWIDKWNATDINGNIHFNDIWHHVIFFFILVFNSISTVYVSLSLFCEQITCHNWRKITSTKKEEKKNRCVFVAFFYV